MRKAKSQSLPINQEAIRSQLPHLDSMMDRLMEMAKSLPDSDLKEKRFYEVSCLDSISEVIRQGLDSYPNQ